MAFHRLKIKQELAASEATPKIILMTLTGSLANNNASPAAIHAVDEAASIPDRDMARASPANANLIVPSK
jgi:hypothetical protein